MLVLIDNQLVSAIAASQTLTGSFADLTPVMNLGDVDILNIWVNLDINDSLDVQFRVVALESASSTDLYSLPITATSTTSVAITAEQFLLDNDADQKALIPFSLGGALPYGKIQVKAGTVGASAGMITSAKVNPIRVKGV